MNLGIVETYDDAAGAFSLSITPGTQHVCVDLDGGGSSSSGRGCGS